MQYFKCHKNKLCKYLKEWSSKFETLHVQFSVKKDYYCPYTAENTKFSNHAR